MTDILDLPGWEPTAVRTEDDQYVISADYTVLPDACQKCGVIGRVYKHGPKMIIFRDSPIRGRPVSIEANAQRFRCRECGGTFIQPLGGIHPATRMTARCVQYIEEQCLRDTFTRIAEHVGCDDKTVRTLAGDYIDRLNAEYKPWLPEWLGIDETQIDGKLRCIITDVVNGVAKVINRAGRGYSFEVLRARLLYGKLHKKEPVEGHMKKRTADQLERQIALVEALGSRCGSCNGVFDADELETHTLPPITKDEIRREANRRAYPKRVHICSTCYRRFHTEGAIHGSQPST